MKEHFEKEGLHLQTGYLDLSMFGEPFVTCMMFIC